ncbi:hypothetical protein ZWY2020_024385 [Hordeum vulgare]|nr:hypothetical protein ZWY2020_024385 [Hordeum vulgare]
MLWRLLLVFRGALPCYVSLPQPLLGTPVPSHGEKNDERRSGCLDKKNKACNVPTSKRAEYRMLEAFGELSEVSKAEDIEQKMQAYVDMYKKLLSPQVIEALSSLTGSKESQSWTFQDVFHRIMLAHDSLRPQQKSLFVMDGFPSASGS